MAIEELQMVVNDQYIIIKKLKDLDLVGQQKKEIMHKSPTN